MKVLVTPAGNFGPYASIKLMADRYRCDNEEIPLSVIGTAEIVEAETVQFPVLPPTREQLKAAREIAVAAITVTTAAGHTFDGDETSQTRMARAIIALQATGTPSVLWVLTDNTVIDAPVAELVEALALAGAAQAAMWVLE